MNSELAIFILIVFRFCTSNIRCSFSDDGEKTPNYSGYYPSNRKMDCEDGTDSINTKTDKRAVPTTAFNNGIINLPSQMYNYPTTDQKQCCQDKFNLKKFIITSPNFPYSLNENIECIYKIEKSDENVCRLRFNLLYFWLGEVNNDNCLYGSLELDGKFICGCNKEVKLVRTLGNNTFMLLKFKSEGYKLNSQSGFIIEIIQDACPEKYNPDNLSNNIVKDLRYEKKELNKTWSNTYHETLLQKLQLIKEQTEIIDDDYENNIPLTYKPKITKSIYYFAEPEFNTMEVPRNSIENPDYMFIPSINSIVTDLNIFKCTKWNQVQIRFLVDKFDSIIKCTRKYEDTKPDTNCIDVLPSRGYFRSPGYPSYYPGNLNVCYRFRKHPGYCGIKIYFTDFHIEKSFGCSKDYVVLGSYKHHCGCDLQNKFVILERTDTAYEDLRFMSDSLYCGRGFSGIYEQIACKESRSPINRTVNTEVSIPKINCDASIKDRIFTLELLQNYAKCTFTIQKFSTNVCKINLYFNKFELLCTMESLVIDNMVFCGNLTGRMVTMGFVNKDGEKNILYKGKNPENIFEEVKFKIIGEQITDDCLVGNKEVPAERLTGHAITGLPIIHDAISENDISDAHKKYQIKMTNEYFREICGILSITNIKKLPEKLCIALLRQNKVIQCKLLEPTVTYNPIQQQIMELEIPFGHIEAIPYEEIDCDSIN